MKKRLCFVLVIVMLISAVYPCQAAIRKEIESKSVNSFCALVNEIREKYQLTENDYEYDYNMNNPLGTENRLIVKTENQIESNRAVEIFYALDYAILQYDDKQSMVKDYESLKEQGYFVEKDRHFIVDSMVTAGEDNPVNWAYEETGANYALANVNSNEEIVIGLLDSCVDNTHPAVKGRIVDTTLNFVDGSGDSTGVSAHGTYVASVIAMSTPDNVKIKPYQVFNRSDEGTLLSFISAVEYILNEDDKPDILNISFSGYNPDKDDTIESHLITKLVESGITVCVASGDNNLPAEYSSPASNADAITVAAYDNENDMCYESNYGPEIDVAAPGYNVFSASYNDEFNDTFYGTSAACAFVSSACAYALMQNPDLTPAEVKEKIKSTAIYMGEDDSVYFGSGKLSISNLIGDKVDNPVPSVEGGLYHEAQTVEFSNIPSDAQLVYTLDGSVPSSTNGEIYTAPITIDNEMQLTYTLMKDGKYISNIESQYYTVQYFCDESEFEISLDGQINHLYSKEKNNIVVPDTINGIEPVSLSFGFFNSSNLKSIVLPDSVTSISRNCFRYSNKLKHITARGVKEISGSAFQECCNLRDVVMPQLEKVDTYTFDNCFMLREIDFENSLKSFSGYAFRYTGLTSLNLTNLDTVTKDIRYVFEGVPLINCSIPSVETLGTDSFLRCHYLRNLNAPDVKTINTCAFSECYSLSEFDMPNVTAVEGNAFSNCYIDTLYAPKLTELKQPSLAGTTTFGRQNHSRVIDFPSLTELGSNAFWSMSIEELYLKNVETMSERAFNTLSCLNVVYMPKVKEFYLPTGGISSGPPLGVVWTPMVEDAACDSTTKLLFAPNATTASLSCYDTIVALSDKITKVNINPIYDSYQNNVFPTIIAPPDSPAWNQWANNYPEYDDPPAISYVDTNDVNFVGLDFDNNLVYTVNDKEIKIPFFFVSDFWDEYTINESRYSAPYIFVFDFTNDGIVNAKDYAELYKFQNSVA